MSKNKLTSILLVVVLFLFGGQYSNQMRNAETITITPDQKKHSGFQTSQQKGNLSEPSTMPMDDDELTSELTPKCTGYQADVININNYQVLVFGKWVTRKCHYGLIWNQIKCQCDWDKEKLTALEESSQSECDLTLNITFDGRLVRDYAKNTYIQVEPIVLIQENTGEDQSSRVHNGHFAPGRLTLHFFAGNSYSDMFQLSVGFKTEENALNSLQEVTLITNACVINLNGTEATIALKINSTRQQLSFVVNDHLEHANLNAKVHEWHKLEVSFVKGTVYITNNGQEILNSTAYPATVNHSECPLSIGGDPTDAMQNFYGYFDSILLWRQCPVKPEINA